MKGPGGYQRRRRGQGVGGQGPRGPGVPAGEQKRSLIETALLIALIEESGHGYALIERVHELVGRQVYVDPGSVYRILRLLEEAGVVSSSWEPSSAGPRRRTYTLEPSGRELLRSWAAILTERGNALLHLSRIAEERLA
ncbi:MAG: PadR family transcriptional regulator [Actinobacteria bacterium]|nr:PadR family transcriptional regulator [Actinomycetota bacterium]